MHLRLLGTIWGLVAFALADAGQHPLSAGSWSGRRWDDPPDPDATGHLLFDTAVNLLKHWSNAYHRNGHNVVSVAIPPGTLLYHGRAKLFYHSQGGIYDPTEPPTGPEWLTPDEDHALYFSAWEGHLYTYTATRELRLLYFDGTSAAVLPTGTQDTQDVIIYGNVTEFHWSPFIRITQLCDWAQKYRLDGFVRMEFDFEIMYCNFTDGLKLISDVDVVPAVFDPPEGWVGSLRPKNLVAYETIVAGNWHNWEPLAGMHVDYSKLISFYDPKYRSLVELRRKASSRSEHRLQNISASDVHTLFDDLDDILTRAPTDRGSRFDWRGLMRHIVEQFADRLQYLQHLVHAQDDRRPGEDGEPHDIASLIFNIRQQVLTMLAPYISRRSFATLPGGALNDTWYEQTIARCTSAHTAHLNTTQFTPQEHVLKSAVEETLHEICRTLVLIWRTAYTSESIISFDQQLGLVEGWKSEMDRLINWLDWAVWQQCSPACSEDHMCSVPQWPFDGILNGTERSTPRCISKLHWKPNNWRPSATAGDGMYSLGGQHQI
ncbi:hypothetical protein CALVIDRAFT_519719 [Calocera viscosa TUFC12733]|uniref:Uncharacterized protein n=1 Tax=Calocera viscosa (strain TUFC12733) TaxID=1330018 RepID=A0A167ISX8_CALVF|nr:hypothetical protein CALVIDRAFT_519719 [Calocera viscosa TUFC12733]